MKKYTFFLLGLLLNTALIFGQNQPEPIQVKKGFGTAFIHQGKNLTPRQLLDLTETNAEAYQEMKIAKTNYNIGSVISFAGGFMVGWPLGTALGGGEANWTLAGVGAGLIVASIPFSISYTKHAQKAVDLYNAGLGQSWLGDVNFGIGFCNHGLGLKMTF